MGRFDADKLKTPSQEQLERVLQAEEQSDRRFLTPMKFRSTEDLLRFMLSHSFSPQQMLAILARVEAATPAEAVKAEEEAVDDLPLSTQLLMHFASTLNQAASAVDDALTEAAELADQLLIAPKIPAYLRLSLDLIQRSINQSIAEELRSSPPAPKEKTS